MLRIDLLQRDFSKRDDGNEDDNDDRYRVWVALGDEYVGCYFVMDILTKHEETCNGDCDVKEILLRLLARKL